MQYGRLAKLRNRPFSHDFAVLRHIDRNIRQGYTNTSHSREDALVQEDVAPIRVGLLGAGTVGSQTARLLVEQKDELAARIGRPIELTGVACLDPSETDPFPWIDKSVVTTDTMSVATNADIVVELIGGTGGLSVRACGHRIRRFQVTANKALLAKYGPELCRRRAWRASISTSRLPWAAPSRSSSRCANPSSETR